MQSGIRFNMTFPQPTKHYNVKMYFVDDILTEMVGDLSILVRKNSIIVERFLVILTKIEIGTYILIFLFSSFCLIQIFFTHLRLIP